MRQKKKEIYLSRPYILLTKKVAVEMAKYALTDNDALAIFSEAINFMAKKAKKNPNDLFPSYERWLIEETIAFQKGLNKKTEENQI